MPEKLNFSINYYFKINVKDTALGQAFRIYARQDKSSGAAECEKNLLPSRLQIFIPVYGRQDRDFMMSIHKGGLRKVLDHDREDSRSMAITGQYTNIKEYKYVYLS